VADSIRGIRGAQWWSLGAPTQPCPWNGTRYSQAHRQNTRTRRWRRDQPTTSCSAVAFRAAVLTLHPDPYSDTNACREYTCALLQVLLSTQGSHRIRNNPPLTPTPRRLGHGPAGGLGPRPLWRRGAQAAQEGVRIAAHWHQRHEEPCGVRLRVRGGAICGQGVLTLLGYAVGS
jgi:hypothetical protein